MSRLLDEALDSWRALDPPAWVLATVATLVLVVPGGIPLTAVAFPIYRRHRLALAA